MSWTIDEHLGIGTPHDGDASDPLTPDECPGCGTPDEARDEFCHGCGHAFAHVRGSSADEADEMHACPMCRTGELMRLEHGRTQCESCGYMVRDEGM